MNATRLTIILISVAAVIFSGCSTDNRVLGPVTDTQSGAGIGTANRVGIDSDSGFDSNESAPGQKHFTILAKVQSLDVEGGCLYLEADNGNSYTPVSPKGLVLESGLKFKADGYVDENIQFFCGNGPAFVIENYDIISRPDPRDSKNTSEKGLSKDETAPDNGNSGFVTIKGSVDFAKEGCLILKTADKSEYVLQHDTDIQLDKGEQISATGYISLLLSFTCYEAPVFYAETISISNSSKEPEESKLPENEMAPGTTYDDNDRYITPLDDRRPEDEMMDMGKEFEGKEKDEAEGTFNEPPKDERAPSVPDSGGDDESYQGPDDDRNSQGDMMDKEKEIKEMREAEERGTVPENERP